MKPKPVESSEFDIWNDAILFVMNINPGFAFAMSFYQID